MKFDDQYNMDLHRDDKWIDEIRLLSGERQFLRLLTIYRYKTSGLSGDEWRVSSMWQCHESFVNLVQRDCEPFHRDSRWYSFDGPYKDLSVGCAVLFPSIYGSQPLMHEIPVDAIDFVRKGRVLYRSTHDEKPLPLIACAGHLSWSFVMAGDTPLRTDDAWNDMLWICFQAGCSMKASSTYRLIYKYDGYDKKDATAMQYRPGVEPQSVGLIRRFCSLHLNRGDCGLEDANLNYEIIDGPGPEKALGWEQWKSEALIASTPAPWV